MKKILFYLMILVLAGMSCISQTAVPYGSNKGKYQTIKGTRLYYEEYGKGVPLLLIHGGLSSIKDLGAVIPELSKKFRVIAVDCPGQGRSEQADSVSYQLMADYLLAMADQMKLDSLYVLGYSDGGNVALLMAADRPGKIKKAAAFAAASHTSGYYAEATAGLNELSAEVVEKDYRWWLDEHLKRTPQKDKWKKFITDFAKMCATPLIISDEKLQQINSNVLVIQGDNDIVKPVHAVKLHQSIKGSQLCFVPAASHFVLLERPALFNYIIMEFFTKDKKLFDWTQLGS